MTLDNVTVRNAQDVAMICDTQDWDVLMTLDGGERCGKSSVMADLLLVWEPSIDADIRSGIYDTFLSRYAWSWTDWYDLLKRSQKQTVIREEADFLGRESMTEINRRILRILSTVGRRNNKMGLLFPDFWRLDIYARERTRIRGFVHARNLTDEGPKRGYVNWYVRQRFPFPRTSDQNTIWWHRAFTGRFDHMRLRSKNHAEAWERWREAEEKAKNLVLETSGSDKVKLIAITLRKRGYTMEEISSIVSMSETTVQGWVKGIKKETKDEDKKTFLDSISPEDEDTGGERRSGPKGHK